MAGIATQLSTLRRREKKKEKKKEEDRSKLSTRQQHWPIHNWRKDTTHLQASKWLDKRSIRGSYSFMARMKNRHLFAKESFTMDGVAKTAGTFTLPRVLSPHMIQSPVVHCTSSTATSSTTAAAATTTTVTLQHNNCKCTTTTTTTTANSNNINNSNNKISINNSCIRGYTSGSFCYISRFINVIVLLLIILPALLLPVFGGNVNAEKRLSSRIVTTKYGALRGHLVTLPNRSLQPVESFLGKCSLHIHLGYLFAYVL